MSESVPEQAAEAQPDDPDNALDLPPEQLPAAVEAALLVSDRPLNAARLAELFGEVPAKQLREAVAQLNAVYDETGRSFTIEEVAGGWQIVTRPQFAPVLERLQRRRADNKLSPAAMETLAIIAYKQPIIRADLESIRGVACGEVLRSLMDRRLIKIVGRAEVIGRPMLYGTTKQFLEIFGLSALKDLPKVEEFKMPAPPEASEATSEAAAGEASS